MLEIGGYTELAPLHRGPRSLLLRGRRASDGAPVVIKTAAAEFPSAADLRRLRHEFAMGCDASQGPARTHVVQHYALEQVGSSLGLVLEDFNGHSLRRLLDSGPLGLRPFLELAPALVRAVQALHEAALVHLDINPDNVLFDAETGALRLCDLSTSVQLGQHVEELRSFRGTPAYASPETTLRTGWRIDGRADLYSLGVTFFQLLTGKLPFADGDPLETFHRHLAAAPVSPSALRAELPQTLEKVLLRLLTKDPDQRYRGASGLATDLQLCRENLLLTGHVGVFELGAHDRSSHLNLSRRLYGREREFLQLVQTFQRAADGERAFVIVSGAAGTGKSSLVAELQASVLARGGQFCSGKFEAFSSNAPYAAFSGALRGLVHALLARPSAELRRWRERLLAAVGPNGQQILSLAPEFELLIGPQPAAPALEAEQAQAAFRHVILETLVALATHERPLVLFLDDIHWADLASLALASDLVADERFRHALLICSYRKNEATAVNELHQLFKTMHQSRALLELEVADLEVAHVEQLVVDATGQGADSIRPLARLISKKTRGNPFFVEQFLQMLQREHLLSFDVVARLWQWDLAACDAQRSTDNVIDLMVLRLHRLHSATQRALRYAACFGGEFDAPLLASMLGEPRETVDAALVEALQDGLVSPLPAASGAGVVSSYRFQHDQVRQAAYALTSPEERPLLHLRIGRALLAAPHRELIFRLAYQLLQALDLIHDDAERRRVAEVCLLAGRRAKTAVAYAAAGEYLSAGIEVLGSSGWAASYPLMLALHQEYAEACYLGGELAGMEATCATVLKRAAGLMDQLPAQQLRLVAYIARNDLPAAISLAREVLALLGLRLPVQANQATVALRVMRMAWRLRGETTDTLLLRARTEDARVLAAMQVLALVSTPVYLTSPKLFPIIICEMLSLTLDHGSSAWSAEAFLGWGAIQIAGFSAVERGHAIGSAAPRLIELLGAGARRGRTETIYNLLIRHWVEPLRSTIEPLRLSVRHSTEHGDLAYAAIGAVTQIYNMLMAGCPLADVEEAAVDYDKLLGRLGQQRFRQDARRILQLVHCLQGKSADPKRLSGELYDAEESLRAAQKAGDRAALASLHYERALLHFIYGDARAALECCRQAREYLDSVLATVYPPLIDFLSALVRLRLMSDELGSRFAAGELNEVERSLRRLRRWARTGAANNQHRVHLVFAEICRLRGDADLAGREYEHAIERAGQNGYLHEQAMALECAARFYVATGRPRLAVNTLQAARKAWAAWGAAAKAALLDSELSLLAAGQRTLTLELPSARQEAPAFALDVESVVKASQAIVGEIRMPNLARRLLALALENTGAQRGFLLLNVDGQLRVEAGSDLDDVRAYESNSSLRVASESTFSAAVVDYCARRLESLVCPDLSADPLFSHDEYVRRTKPLSLLCQPLVAQGKLSGLVYLENNRLRGAFSADRLEVLRVLSALAAMSLDNARLYEDVAQAHAFQLRLSEAQARFVPAEFLQSLHRASIVDVALGDSIRKNMSILFSDVRGFTALVESMPVHEHVGFINEYLGHMEPAIVQNGGFVDSYLGDGILALFEGYPDNALRAAVAMSQALQRFNRGRLIDGRSPIEMGVGISTGPLTLGTIGGPSRLKCGVIGDPVNLASRIESLTKRLRSFLLISHETRDALRTPDAFELRRVDHVRVKGKSTPIVLYEVLDSEPVALREAKHRSLPRFQEAMAAYEATDFGRAARLFEACGAGVDDGAANSLARRCREFSANPPSEWDGVYSLSEK